MKDYDSWGLMSRRFSFFILHVVFKISKEHLMWWQMGELMTDEMRR